MKQDLLKKGKDRTVNAENLYNIIKQHAISYWPRFEIVAFALYDKDDVYLYNHPKFDCDNEPYCYVEWDEQFRRCRYTYFV